jgi:hypothetical protein
MAEGAVSDTKQRADRGRTDRGRARGGQRARRGFVLNSSLEHTRCRPNRAGVQFITLFIKGVLAYGVKQDVSPVFCFCCCKQCAPRVCDRRGLQQGVVPFFLKPLLCGKPFTLARCRAALIAATGASRGCSGMADAL